MKANDKYRPWIDRILTVNEKDIASLFNIFFTSMAQKLDTYKINKDFPKYWNEMPFVIAPVDIKEIENVISTLQEKKVAWPNILPTKMLKVSKKQLSVPLT